MYEHSQIGKFIFLLLGIVIVLIGGIFILVTLNEPEVLKKTSFWYIFLGVGLMWAIIILLFYRLKVSVDDKVLTIAFGIGMIKFKIFLVDITSSKVSRSKWYYGMGIRFTPQGMLYSVSGLDVVEVIKSNGKGVLIGTDEPEKLNQAIQERIKQTSV